MLVRHVYQTTFQGGGSQLGIGDFIRGSFALLHICKENGWDFEIYLHNHPVSNYFIPRNKDIGIDRENIRSFQHNLHDVTINFLTSMSKRSKEINIITNIYPKDVITEEDRKEISNYFTLKPEIIEEVDIPTEPYSILHIRLGDHNFGKNNQSLFSKVEDAVKYAKGNVYLIADNNEVKNYLSLFRGFKIFLNNIVHLGREEDSSKIKDTIHDFYLMSKAQKIYQYSVYYWGSGFSDYCSKMYNIPLVRL